MSISKLVSKLIGDKREWRQYKARAQRLPASYRTVSVRSGPSVTDRSLRCSDRGRCADQDGGESTTRRKTLAASLS